MFDKKMSTKRIGIIIIALLGIAIFLTSSTYAAISASQTLASSGTVSVSPNLGVYSDVACTEPLTSFNWGTLSPGGVTNQTIYVKNTGAGVTLTLSMVASNWSPSNADSYINLSWNPSSYTLTPGAATKAVISLAVSSSIVDIQSFNVQISINGSNP